MLTVEHVFSTDGFRGKVADSRPTICYYSCKLTGAAESVSGRCQRHDYRPMCMHRKEVFIDEITNKLIRRDFDELLLEDEDILGSFSSQNGFCKNAEKI